MCLNGLPTPLDEPDMTNINSTGISRASRQELTCTEKKKAKGRSSAVRVNQNLPALSTVVGTRHLFNWAPYLWRNGVTCSFRDAHAANSQSLILGLCHSSISILCGSDNFFLSRLAFLRAAYWGPFCTYSITQIYQRPTARPQGPSQTTQPYWRHITIFIRPRNIYSIIWISFKNGFSNGG
jgi:hypothetical protein